MGLAVSRNPLLRLLRRLPLPRVAIPQVLGVDDWAVRKGQTSGTVLIDRERHQALALLPDREAKTVALWLPAHPGVGVITRDRFSASADGARQGAPDAIQVADRFHLLQHLAEALDQVFKTHRNALDAVHEALGQAAVTRPDGRVAVPVPPPSPPRTAQELAHQRQTRRMALHQQIWVLHQQGWPGRASAQQLGMGKNTVFRDLRTETLPARKRRTDRGGNGLAPYKPISSTVGTPAAVTPGDSSASSNRGAIPEAMPPWRARPSVCATRQGRHPGSGDPATRCRS